MKALLLIFARLVVGVLFIFSGLIKLNDPVGFGFKLEDYFAPDVLNLPFLVPLALFMAVSLVIFEVLLGVALLIGFAKRFTLWSLLLLTVFFTFLTFYSAYFNKVTDCGCFGDAIPLTPWQSFYKDVILLVLILILFYGRKRLGPLFGKRAQSYIMAATFIGCLIFANHVLRHLPVKDFRAYKVGVNIPEGMTVPPDAPKPVYEYSWEFDINGQAKTIKTDGSYPTVDGELLGVDTKLIKKGYEAPIHDFSIEMDGEDHIEEVMAEDKLLMVLVYNLERTQAKGFDDIKAVTDEALQKGYTVIGLSASSQAETKGLARSTGLNFDFYFCDETALKTVVRSNPGLVRLEKGTIMEKAHWRDAGRLRL